MPRSRSVNKDAEKALRFEGMDEILQRVSDVMDRTTGKAAKEVYLKAGLALRDKARNLAPRGTVTHRLNKKSGHIIEPGDLKESIFVDRGDENKPNVLVGVNYNIAPHAHWVEYGTVKTPPHPYLRPAVSATAQEMRTIVEKGLRQIIEDAANGRN